MSKGSVASAWATTNAVTECLSGMLDTHAEYSRNAMSVCVGSWDLALLAGLDQRGGPFVNLVGDPMAGGLGARPDSDGVDTGGLAMIPMGRVPDVEMSEFSYPMLYLWRREETDSGGPGRYRGGLGGSSAFVVYDSPAPEVALVVSGGGKAMPQSSGMSGGYPANTQYDVAVRNSNIRELLSQGTVVTDIDQVQGEHEPMPPHLETKLGLDDVYFLAWQGGGGYGDPLHREPDAVAADVLAEKVTSAAARDVYGVILHGDKTVDHDATVEQRRAIRRDRAAEAQQPEGDR